jgi:ABC-type spermidine/putrescine transport system permease subunit I
MINGSALVYIVCLGFYVTPALLGGPKDQMIARFIGSQIEQLLDWQEATTMAAVLLAATLVIFALYDHFFGLDRLWRS